MGRDFILSTQCACLDEKGNAWIFSNEMNALFYRNMESGEIQYVTSIEREDFCIRELYSEAVWFQKKVFLIPFAAKDIAVYDTVRVEIRYITLNIHPDHYNVVRLPGNRLLLYSVRERMFAYVVSLEKLCCNEMTIDYGKKEAALKGKLLRGTAYCDGKAYFVIDKTNMCAVLDVDKKTVQICQMEKEAALFRVASDGRYLYFMHADGCAYDVYRGCVYVKTIMLSNRCGDENADARLEQMEYTRNTVLDDGHIVSIPMKTQPIVVMHGDKLIMFPLEDKKIGRYKSSTEPVVVCKAFRNKLFFFPYHSDVFVSIDLITAEVKYQSAKFDITQCDELFRGILKRKRKMMSESYISLEMLMGIVQNYISEPVDRYENSGAKIYEYVSKQHERREK